MRRSPPRHPQHRKKTHKPRLSGFTLIEVVISIGIVGLVSSIVATQISPASVILAVDDTSANHAAGQLTNALIQYQIARNTLPGISMLTEGGPAVPVCKQGFTRDSSCVQLDALITEGILSGIPTDNREPCMKSYSGFTMTLSSGRPVIIVAQKGKKHGDGVMNCLNDTIAPEMTNIATQGIGANTATITWTTDEEADSRIEYGLTTVYDNLTTINTQLVTSHSMTLTGLLENTLYHFRVRTRDAAGNLEISADQTFRTADVTAPIITAAIAQSISGNGATITWRTNEPATSQVLYGIGVTDMQEPAVPDGTLVTDHAVVLQDLIGSTTYTYKIVSADTSTNTRTSTSFTFTTQPDITPPIITNMKAVSGTNGNSAVVTWTTNENADTVVEYGTSVAYGASAATAGWTKTHTQTISNLRTNTLYHFRILSRDTSGNLQPSQDVTVTILDIAPPTISAVSVTSNTGTSAVIQWTTDEPADTQLAYGTTQAYGTLTTLNPTPVTSHSVTLTNLTHNTTYVAQLRSKDASANLSVQDGFPFTTINLNPVVSAIASSVQTNAATITWTTNVAASSVVEYGMTTSYGSGSVSGTPNSTSHTVNLPSLPADTSFHYHVVSTDARGYTGVSGDQQFSTNAAVAVYRFEEAVSGPPADSSGNSGLTATLSTPAPTVTSSPAPTIIANARSLSFNGSSNYVLTPNLRSFFSNDTVTVAAWIYPTAGGVVIDELGQGVLNTGWHDSQMEVLPTGEVKVRVWNMTPLSLGSVSFNQWNHVAYRYNKATTTFDGFLNGVKAASLVGTRSSPYASGYSVYYGIGASDGVQLGDGTYFDGKIDEVRIYNTALSDKQIASLAETTGLPDTTPPTLTSGPTVSAITQTTATISWNTNEAANTQLWYGTTPNPNGGTAAVATLLTSHIVSLSGLQPNTVYYIRVRSKDGAGNQFTATTDATFTTLGDTTPPVPSGLTCTSVSPTSLQINWTTNEAADTQIWYKTSPNPTSGTPLDQTLNTIHSQTITSLPTNATIYYRIRSKDSSGNLYMPSLDAQCITDGTAPVITSGPTVTALSTNGATITWTTNEVADTRVSYGPTVAYGSGSSSTSLVTAHTVTLKNLVPGMTYHFRVQSSDYAGNIGSSNDTTFMTNTPSVGPLAWYTFNETNGSAVPDASGNGLTATAAGNPSRIPGKLNNAISLTGTSQYVTTPLQPENTFTMAAWFRLNSNTSGAYQTILSVDNANYLLIDVLQNQGSFWISDSTIPAGSNLGVTNLSANVWYHLVVVRIGDNAAGGYKIYFNGSLVGSATSGVWGGGALNIGYRPSYAPSQNFNGLLDDVRYYNRALSSGEVSSLYATGDTTPPNIVGTPTVTPITSTNVTITWSTDEPSDSQVWYNTSPSPTSGTEVNASKVTSHSMTVSGLTPGATYYYRIRSKDANGNQYTDSADRTFTTDGTPPVVTAGPTVVQGLTNTATITWTTNELSDTQVWYGTAPSPTTGTAIVQTGVTGHSATLTGLAAGTKYYYRIRSADIWANQYTSGDATFTTDGTPPALQNGPTVTGLTANGATISWTTNESSDTQVWFGVMPNPTSGTAIVQTGVTSHSATLAGLTANTTYYYRLRSADGWGNQYTSGDFTLSTDVTPPTITAGPTAGTVGATTATIAWTTNEAATTVVDYGQTTTYAATVSTGGQSTSHSQTITGLSSNTLYHYRVRTTDAAGNTSTSSDATFTTVDTTPPVLSAIAALVTSDTTANITWTTDEIANSQVEYGLTTTYDSATAIDANFVTAHTQSLSGLSPNTTYHYRVKSRDVAGNLQTSTTDKTFHTTDTFGPTLSAIGASVGTNSATVTWNTNKDSDTVVEYGLTSAYGRTASALPLVTSHSQQLTGLSVSTTYHYRVKSSDASGNATVSGDLSFTTLADIVPPIISAITNSNVGETVATIGWTTDEPADTQMEYGLTTALGTQTMLNTSLTLSHSQQLMDLLPNTLYYYHVLSKDASGNLSTSNITTVTTIDITPPVITSHSAIPRPTAGTVVWTTNEGATSQVEYGLTTSYTNVTSINGSLDTIHSVLLSPLQSNVTYHYRIRTRDAAGNLTVSNDDTFATDSIPPVISGANALQITQTGALVAWVTNELADGRVDNGLTTAYGQSTADVSLTKIHAIAIGNLTAGTTYHYRITTTDIAGNASVSQGDLTFTTAPDTAPPSFSAISVTNIGPTSAIVSWTTDEPADTQVDYGLTQSYTDQTALDSTLQTLHTQQITGLSAATPYHFRLRSKDAAGNQGISGDGSFVTSP